MLYVQRRCLSVCLCVCLWHRNSQTDGPTLMRFFHLKASFLAIFLSYVWLTSVQQCKSSFPLVGYRIRILIGCRCLCSHTRVIIGCQPHSKPVPILSTLREFYILSAKQIFSVAYLCNHLVLSQRTPLSCTSVINSSRLIFVSITTNHQTCVL